MPKLETHESRHWIPRPAVLAGMLAVVAVVVVTYRTDVVWLGKLWEHPDYQHGYFVLPFSLFLLWYRRDMLKPLPESGSWVGVPFIVLAAVMHWGGDTFYYHNIRAYSLIPMVTGIVLLLGGWRAMLWAWPSVLFLVFMLPVPNVVKVMLSQPLQRIGAVVSVYLVQTLGIPAVAEGNVIVLSGARLDVEQACSGLRMMTVFFAMCVGGAFVMRGQVWEKLIVVVSAVPIAVAANVARIAVTALCAEAAVRWPDLMSLEFATTTLHDWAGWFVMMPLAMLLLWGEVSLLRHLLPELPTDSPIAMGSIGKQPSTDGA